MTKNFFSKNKAALFLFAGVFPAAVAYAGWIGAHLETGSTSNSVSDADQSGAIGQSNTIGSAINSLAVGTSNTITESPGTVWDSLAVGAYNTVEGDRSVAIGYNNQVLDDYSGAIGKGLIVDDRYSVAVGGYNDTTAYSGDVSFVVGIGTSTSTASNAVIVYKDGKVVLPNPQGGISMGSYTAP